MILISLIAVITILPFMFKKEVSKKVLLTLLSLSVGTLLGGVFIHFLPEIAEHDYTLNTAYYLLSGFMVFSFLKGWFTGTTTPAGSTKIINVQVYVQDVFVSTVGGESASANLVPGLHRHCKLKDSMIHVLAIIVGIAIMAALTLIEVAY